VTIVPGDSAQLTVLVGDSLQKIVTLTMDVIPIGRHPDNGLMLADREVSRDHAELRRGPQGYALTDLGSTNGTFLNDAQLSPHVPYLLHSGDRIRIGKFQLIYEAGELPQLTEEGTVDEGIVPAREEKPAAERVVTEQDVRYGSQAIDLADHAGRHLQGVRQALPMPLAPGPRSRYLKYLPAMFSDDDFLGRYLMIVESLWEPLEQRQHYIHMYFDPRTAPASFLRWLGTWMGLEIEARWPEKRSRELLTEAMDLYRFRGTLYGLRRILEVSTGITPEITDWGQVANGGQPFVFRVKMKLPKGCGVDRELVEELINAHKPACAGYILETEP
jgi:phage tail-like protein